MSTIFDRFRANFLVEDNYVEETRGQGIVEENFSLGQGIIFRNLTPKHGSFLDFPAAPTRMFVGQIPPPPLPEYDDSKQHENTTVELTDSSRLD